MTSTYSRDNLAALPTDDDDLTTAFASPADYNAVASNDGTTVDQSGTEGYALFEWKETATGNSGTFTWKGKSTKAPSESKVQMQIYKRTGTGAPVWEDVPDASDNSTAADTNFTISGTVSDLTNYKADITNEVALRTWQAASAAEWSGTNWVNVAGVLTNTPGLGTEKLANPHFTGTYISGHAPNWTASPTPAESTDAQDGDSKAQTVGPNSDGNCNLYSADFALTAGDFVKAFIYGKNLTDTTTANVQIMQDFDPWAGAVGSTGWFGSNSYTLAQITGLIPATGDHYLQALGPYGTGQSVRYDNASVKVMPTVDMFYTKNFGKSAMTIEIPVTTVKQICAGGVTCLDDPDNPQNYFIFYINRRATGVTRCYLAKVISGVPTMNRIVSAEDQVYSDGYVLKIVNSGTDITLYYNDVSQGTYSLVEGDPVGYYHGFFSTDPLASLNYDSATFV